MLLDVQTEAVIQGNVVFHLKIVTETNYRLGSLYIEGPESKSGCTA